MFFVLDTRFQNRSEPVPNCSGSAVPTYKVEPQPEPLPEPLNTRRPPYGMTYQHWQAAITAGRLGMDAAAIARLGVKAAWKVKAAA